MTNVSSIIKPTSQGQSLLLIPYTLRRGLDLRKGPEFILGQNMWLIFFPPNQIKKGGPKKCNMLFYKLKACQTNECSTFRRLFYSTQNNAHKLFRCTSSKLQPSDQPTLITNQILEMQNISVRPSPYVQTKPALVPSHSQSCQAPLNLVRQIHLQHMTRGNY